MGTNNFLNSSTETISAPEHEVVFKSTNTGEIHTPHVNVDNIAVTLNPTNLALDASLTSIAAILSVPTQYAAPVFYATTNAYADIPGSKIDTAGGQKNFAALLKETGGTNGVTFQVVVSLDDSTYTAVKAYQVDGTQNGSTDIAVSANASTHAILYQTTGTSLAFRYYKIQAKSTTSNNSGHAVAVCFAK